MFLSWYKEGITELRCRTSRFSTSLKLHVHRKMLSESGRRPCIWKDLLHMVQNDPSVLGSQCPNVFLMMHDNPNLGHGVIGTKWPSLEEKPGLGSSTVPLILLFVWFASLRRRMTSVAVETIPANSEASCWLISFTGLV